MKKYFMMLFGVLFGICSCQKKEANNSDDRKQAEIEANKKVIRALIDQGDNPIVSREVFHWVYFKNENDKNNYLKEVTKEGFVLVSSNRIKDEFPYQLQIKRIDKVDENSVNEYVIYLWEKAIEYNGDYDGWETSIEKT